MTASFYIFISSVQRYKFLHIITNTYLFFEKSKSHPNRCEVITSVTLICISLMINEILSTFSFVCCSFVYYLWRMCIQVFCLLYILGTLVKDQLTIYEWVISKLSILFHWPKYLSLCQYHTVYLL